MKKSEQKSTLVNTLAEGHTITAACKRAGVSRMFYDRHYKKDIRFRQKVDDAREAGRTSNSDLIKTVYLKKVRDGHWPAIHYAIKKEDEIEAKQAASPRVTVGIGDVRRIIDELPEPYRSIHHDHIIQLISDATEFERTGKVSPPHPDGL